MYFLLKLGIFQLVMLIFQGGGNSNLLLFFSPGEMIQFDEHIFQLGGSTTN